MDSINIAMAFAGGVLSFLSPCILPLAPGYLGMISGVSVGKINDAADGRQKIILSTVSFILGFSLVFVMLGLASSLIGQLLRGSRMLFAQIGGVIVILLGLHQTGLLPIAWLYRERRVNATPGIGMGGAFLTGLAFAFGWTPCVGPILGGILAVAGNQDTMGAGLVLLMAYSVGLGLPFLVLAIAFEKISVQLNKLKPYMKYLQWLSGGLLILMGLLLVTNNLTVLTQWFMRITGGWSPEMWFEKR
ncbi:MAG TPA: cytochrome c biogenesis protein CcdA [Bacillota bacterium]|nr:cytochrome c biogenesis protein CcdA [Bacillota bacterium]HPT86280.1 cytochrome c biogenesis protein CcdA [Bacillota bacterium]